MWKKLSKACIIVKNYFLVSVGKIVTLRFISKDNAYNLRTAGPLLGKQINNNK